MAVFIAAADGVLSSAAAVWKTVDATSLNYVVTGATALTTAYQESTAFTPGAITITGICVHVAVRAASPSGTISVRLAQAGATVAGTEVTINVSDIDRPGGASLHAPGLYFFKFAAPVLLIAATLYTVSAKTSVNGQVSLYRGAGTNWARMLRTDTFGNPGAGDDWHVLGEWTAAATKTNITVQMDETAAVDYGSGSTDLNLQGVTIGKGGTLTFLSVAATNYVLQMSTGLRVWAGGVLNIGTIATPIPRDSTATLQFDCAADGNFGGLIDGTVNIQGLSRTSGKNVVQCLLNTDEAAAQTVLGVDTDTGWKNGDIVDIASTTRTFSQSEQRTMNADATSTTITVSAGLTNAHSGTSPTQAEVILLTRNVIVRSVSTTAMAFFTIGDTGTADIDWCWFRYLGTAVEYKYGLQLRNNGGVSGSSVVSFCSFSDFENAGIAVYASGDTTLANITVEDCVFASRQAAAMDGAFGTGLSSGSNIIFRRLTCTAIDGSSGNRFGFNFLAMPRAVISDIRASGCEATGVFFTTPTSTAEILDHGTISNITSHSNANEGIGLYGNFVTKISTVSVWRNNNALSAGGLQITDPGYKEITGGQIFGNATTNVFVNAATQFTLRGVTVAGDTTFSVATGLAFNGSSTFFFTRLEACSFGDVSGIFTAHTTQDIGFGGGRKQVDLSLIATLLDSATELGTTAVLQGRSVIRYQRQDDVTNVHLTNWVNWGVITRDTTISHAGSPSEKIAPTVAYTQNRFPSATRIKPAASGATVNIECYILRDVTYTGSAPRLMLRANSALGVDADTLLYTSIGVAGTWERLAGTAPAAPEAGAWEFYVDCDGAVGFINTDDWL